MAWWGAIGGAFSRSPAGRRFSAWAVDVAWDALHDDSKECVDDDEGCKKEHQACHKIWVDFYERRGRLIGTDANAEYRKFMRSCLPKKCAENF